uniref:WD_REPEATS_REGION domain-containing protein n=1 Tax=Hydatigena taeniaeformis TaxID=6205 RepID=A0A0R3WZH8_HYDTA
LHQTSQAPLLLTSAADCGKQEAILAWDPIAGNQVASFSGFAAASGTLTTSNGIVFSAVCRKPIIQSWSLQSSASFKRLTTKGVVNALAFSHDGFFMFLAIEKSIYVYQVCSGCLIAVLEASHMAPIGSLVVSQRQAGLPLPLLLSADTSGLVACWLALVSSGESFAIGSRDSTNISNEPESDNKHKPLCVLEESRPIRCLCVLPQDDRFIFAGTDNGVLHSIWLRDPKKPSACEVAFRRCFVDVELPSTEKAICHACASPVDSGLSLLAVSTLSGLVEILRQDACLVRLQSFSVVPPLSGNSGSPRITGLLMVTRPSWLLESQTALSSSAKPDASGSLESLRPAKRHLGWHVEDLLYLQLPNLKRDRISDDYLGDIYQDEFFLTTPSRSFALPIDTVRKCTASTSNTSAEVSTLRREKEALERRNGELMRILVANCLHY